MNKNWVSPNTIVGDAATGIRYLRREEINSEFWAEVKKGNHILFVAPRRVGKTSIMKDLAENPAAGYTCIYQNIEGVKSRNEFYQRLFELILHCVTKVSKAKALLGKWQNTYQIGEITKAGIKFNRKDIDYEVEVRSIIPELVDAQIHTVLFLDEFAEVILKLQKQGKQQDAIDILHTLREFRSDENFRHFTLVFAGSIGLEYVIKSIDRPKIINDIYRIHTVALSKNEADKLIYQLLNGSTITLDETVQMYLCDKIQHLLPYYIQLMLQELDTVAKAKSSPVINDEMIDEAFRKVVVKNTNFEDWLVRLRDYQQANFPFINAILIMCAHKKIITVQEVYDLAEKFSKTDNYMDFVDELMVDGYLIEFEEHKYQFLSPFLQNFWLKKFPIYHA